MKKTLMKRILSAALAAVTAVTMGLQIPASAATPTFEEYIKEELKGCPSSIDVSYYQDNNGWDKATVKQKFIDVINSDPAYFYVKASSVSNIGWNSKTITSIPYSTSYAEAAQLYEDYKKYSFEEYVSLKMREYQDPINVSLYYLDAGSDGKAILAKYQALLKSDKSLPYDSTAAKVTTGTKYCILKDIQYSDKGAVASSSVTLSEDGYEEFDEYLTDKLESFATSIDITDYYIAFGWNTDACNAYFLDFLQRSPDVFFVSTTINTSVTSSAGSGKVTGAKFTDIQYICKKSEYASMKKKFDAAVETAMLSVDDTMSEMEKALALHDYIIMNCDYETNVLSKSTYSKAPASAWTAYGARVVGKAVCQGYALAYSYLLEKCGIEAKVVSSDEMDHAWNYVNIDGKWYNVDVTWDDPTTGSDYKIKPCTGSIKHEYFLISDTAIKKAEKPHTGYDNYRAMLGIPAATSTKYDKYFWRNVGSQIVKLGNYWYYTVLDEDSPCFTATSYDPDNLEEFALNTIIMKYNPVTNKSAEFYTVNSMWLTWGIDVRKTISYWQDSYLGLGVFNGKLYYNTATAIYSLSTAGKASLAYTPDTSKGYIYGIYFKQNVLYYELRTAPNKAGTVKKRTYSAGTATDIDITKSAVALKVGKATTLATKKTPTASKDKLYWSTSNYGIATVSSTGTVTAKKAGTCYVVAKNNMGLWDSVKITVTK